MLRSTRDITLGSVENDVDLSVKAGLNTNQVGQVNAFFRNTANKGSSGTGVPATRSGTNWRGGSIAYWINTATINGATGAVGSTGSTGTTGGQGAAGAGGRGRTSGGTPAAVAGGSGSAGGTGGTGGPGGTGGTGGPSFTADTVTGLNLYVDNGGGTINGGTGGSAGPGGPGGAGGPGGGGGGGGGGAIT
jgi:hypothetical protein